MGKTYTYTVRDLDGNIVRSNARCRDLEDLLGKAVGGLSDRAESHFSINGKYYVEIDGEATNSRKINEAIISTKWNDAVKPFRNVEWVKNLEAGVKRLKIFNTGENDGKMVMK